MNCEAVLVSFTLDGHYTTYETSGILFNPNLVLLSGTALIPLVQQEKWISLLVNSSSSKLKHDSRLEKLHFRVFTEHDSNSDKAELRSYEGQAIGLWKCPLVSESSKKLFRDWVVGHVDDESKTRDPCSDDIDLSKELTSVFILVKCEGRGQFGRVANGSDDEVRILLNSLSSLESADRGQVVEVVSTPFGQRLFVNSLSRGVVSNVVGLENCIILTDARTVSGSEGGPIFLAVGSRQEQENHKLVGIVTNPLIWWRGEWVGLTIGVSLLPVLKKLLRLEDVPSSVRATEGLSSDSLPFKFIDESVVLVRSKDSWGSGVVLDGISGIVITCSHVVKHDKIVSVFHMGSHWSADVIYKTADNVAYDLAILKIRHFNGNMREAKFSEKAPKIGQTVVAAGFPFFSEQDDISIRPTVVTGCISRVNSHMIQTTCCIQSGFSGGPLFLDGELLGIIISNTKSPEALFPHFNFIIPTSVFKEPFLNFIKTNDPRSLKDLESSNVEVQSLWKFFYSKL